MVSIVRRMTKLRALLGVRIGPGAAILPPEVARIHMDFAAKLNDGHFGPRKFWRIYLPQLKYHNPAVPMSINRTTDQDGPAVMTVYFKDPTSSIETTPSSTSTTNKQTLKMPASGPTPAHLTGRTATINMKHRHESEILSQLLSLTNAAQVEPAAEELQQIRELEEQRQLSERDSKRSRTVNEKRKRQEDILAQARGEVAAAREA